MDNQLPQQPVSSIYPNTSAETTIAPPNQSPDTTSLVSNVPLRVINSNRAPAWLEGTEIHPVEAVETINKKQPQPPHEDPVTSIYTAETTPIEKPPLNASVENVTRVAVGELPGDQNIGELGTPLTSMADNMEKNINQGFQDDDKNKVSSIV